MFNHALASSYGVCSKTKSINKDSKRQIISDKLPKNGAQELALDKNLFFRPNGKLM